MAGVAVSPLAFQDQADFSRGAYPQVERIPLNGCEDIVNRLVQDDGTLLRRGGSSFVQTNTVTTFGRALWGGQLVPGNRTLVVGQTVIYSLADDGTLSAVTPISGILFDASVRPVEMGRFVVVPGGNGYWDRVMVYAGASAVAGSPPVAGVSLTFTQGSRVVTASAAAFDAGRAAQGWIVKPTNGVLDDQPGIIDTVDTATKVTLIDPWPYATQTTAAGVYSVSPNNILQIPDENHVPLLRSDSPSYWTQIAGRLVVGQGNKVYFSTFNQASSGITFSSFFQFTGDDYHSLPEGSRVTGIVPLRDVLFVFTSAGVWGVYNMALDLTDAQGNAQQRLEQISRDVILWGQAGIATWHDQLVVPALDDLYLLGSVGSLAAITGGARKLYRSYVRAGYRPGPPGVHRGHYILPILDAAAATVVDCLVWRLDMDGVPFVRWSGHAGLSFAFAQRAVTGSQPQLLALSGSASQPRVTDLSGAFEPSAASRYDADGSAPDATVTLRTVSSPRERFYPKVRAVYELDDGGTDNPVLTADYATGRPGGAFTSAGGSGGEGDSEQVFIINRRTRALRVRLRASNASSRDVLLAVRWFWREPGRS